MSVQDLNARFQYKSDSEHHDLKEKWTILRAPSGPLIGDCEDYALTALWLINGKNDAQFHHSLKTNQARIWFCYTPQGEAHAALEYDNQFIDNIQQTFLPQTDFFAKGYRFSHPMSYAEVNMRLDAGQKNKLPIAPGLATAIKSKFSPALFIGAAVAIGVILWSITK